VPEDNLMPLAEAAKQLSISYPTAVRYFHLGVLRGRKTESGRLLVDEDSIDEFLEACKRPDEVTLTEAADIIGCSRYYIWKCYATGRIPGRRLPHNGKIVLERDAVVRHKEVFERQKEEVVRPRRKIKVKPVEPSVPDYMEDPVTKALLATEVAQRFGIHPNTVRRLYKSGALRGYQSAAGMIFITPESIAEFERMLDEAMTVQRAAEVLGLSEQTVRRLLRDGELEELENCPLPRKGGGIWLSKASVMRLKRRMIEERQQPDEVTLREAAEIIGISYAAAKQRFNSGQLPGRRLPGRKKSIVVKRAVAQEAAQLERALSVSEAAELLGVSAYYVRQLIHKGRLHAYTAHYNGRTAYRITREALQPVIDAATQPGKSDSP